MREFLGCWTVRTDAVEALESFVVDGPRLLLHTCNRASWEQPREAAWLPFQPGATIEHGPFQLTAHHDEAGLRLRIARDGQQLVDQLRRIEGDVMTIEQDEPLTLDRTQVKQVMVYRRDLKMRKGKIAAQCAHASMKVLLGFNTATGPHFQAVYPGPMAVWMRQAFAKIVLSVADEEALNEVARLGEERGIPTARITDAGRTEFKGVPTRTTVALGPWEGGAIDAITGPQGLVETKLA